MIGVIQSLIYLILRTNYWPVYASTIICLASGYLFTGGLHLDGLMDTFDGIFAEKKKRLRAMKDSRIGSFGVQSFVFFTIVQIASLSKVENQILFVLPMCLFWGRFSTLFFINKFKHVTYKKKSIRHKKHWRGLKKESLISIIFILFFFLYYLIYFDANLFLIKNLLILFIGVIVSYKTPEILGNKIGGFNGDACGASVVIVETVMLFIYAILL